MTTEKTALVVTSIFEPNESLRQLASGAVKNDWEFIIVGDARSPKSFLLEGAKFFDLESQRKFDFDLARHCPVGHYSRKNLGYLMAMKNGNTIIVETDDDNTPGTEFWTPRSRMTDSSDVAGIGWFNIYSLFSESVVWPRGLPLENILNGASVKIGDEHRKSFLPVQQGLADGNPDVDAVFRMTQKLPLEFNKRNLMVRLSKGLWSPFNSQNTTWFKEAFPLLYLPSYCTFRMTDIWRSFVAQRIMWECGWELAFHNATVRQERNEHNLLKDFEQEIPGYLGNSRIREILEGLPLRTGKENIPANMIRCYEELSHKKIITDIKELDLLEAWLNDIRKFE